MPASPEVRRGPYETAMAFQLDSGLVRKPTDFSAITAV
ncbi:hypothetical protein HDA32_005377 [Spinactinospora alkalitolerans]|uniref:Uncharacterized protein n=1 Tax=Spinactinospora alkalitolerans TaxID=687207 RepID=A0A852U3U3_9ACTN|nr:hypothetical protein [Spinactinospora alkalitolerans]